MGLRADDRHTGAEHGGGIHGGPSPRLVGAVAAVAFVFGVSALAAELLG